MRKCISLILETTRPDVNKRRQPEADISRQQSEQQDGRSDIRCGKACVMLEPNRAIKRLLTREPRNRGESYENTSKRKAQQRCCGTLSIMTNFMREHRLQFRLGKLR